MSTFSRAYPIMSSGDDQHSYTQNSSYQKGAIDIAQENTRQCILENFDLINLNSDFATFRISEFGCSTGPNTFHAVQNIIDTVKLKHMKENKEDIVVHPLEFQVCSNDQSNNDFNTLFKTQPPSSGQQYFAVGVPGSFYGRVLPKNSINIGHTSYTTHWLSKVPDHVCDKKSVAWNKSYIQCNYKLEEVTKAYKVQFIKDMKVFLEARAEEFVLGGLMIVLRQCLPDGVPLFDTWQGMGVTSKEKIEMFSIPSYFPQFSELEREMKLNKSFKIEKMEIISHPMEHIPLSNDFITAMFRAIVSTLLKEHFGDR